VELVDAVAQMARRRTRKQTAGDLILWQHFETAEFYWDTFGGLEDSEYDKKKEE
jgi:hypothetical protein